MKKAFTLAEVLITLGIIGVVAAMTLPTVIANYKKQVMATQAKKGYNIIMNMMTKIQADEGANDLKSTSLISGGVCAFDAEFNYSGSFSINNKNGCEDLYGNPSVIEGIITKYLKVVKVCKGNSCNISYKDQPLAYVKRSNGDNFMGFYTNDGMIIYVSPIGYQYNPSGSMLSFAYDTNGEKGPNEMGRDLFVLNFCMNGDITYSGDSCTGSSSDNGYLKRLMSNGWKMDY